MYYVYGSVPLARTGWRVDREAVRSADAGIRTLPGTAPRAAAKRRFPANSLARRGRA